MRSSGAETAFKGCRQGRVRSLLLALRSGAKTLVCRTTRSCHRQGGAGPRCLEVGFVGGGAILVLAHFQWPVRRVAYGRMLLL
jgi:hypothetical protein